MSEKHKQLPSGDSIMKSPKLESRELKRFKMLRLIVSANILLGTASVINHNKNEIEEGVQNLFEMFTPDTIIDKNDIKIVFIDDTRKVKEIFIDFKDDKGQQKLIRLERGYEVNQKIAEREYILYEGILDNYSGIIVSVYCDVGTNEPVFAVKTRAFENLNN